MLADVVDRQDVGVVERAGGAGLVLQRRDAVGVPRGMGQQQLDGDVAAEAFVTRAPHLAHATGAEPPIDPIGADPIARLHRPALARNLSGEEVEGGRRQERARPIAGASAGRTPRRGCRRRGRVPTRGTRRAGPPATPPRRRRAVRRGASGHWASASLRARNNQARAKAHSACTVRAEMPRASAVSSTESPPKKRSSTTCALRRSSRARRSEGHVDGEQIGVALTSATSIVSIGTRMACGPPRRPAQAPSRDVDQGPGASGRADTPKKCCRFCHWSVVPSEQAEAQLVDQRRRLQADR